MVLKLRVECVRGMYLKDVCVHIFAMDDSASLLDLHDEILDAVSFERDHLFLFYTANSSSPWAHQHWVSEAEDWGEMEAVFRKTQLKSIWPLGRRKLYYRFDFGDNWIFEIRKMRLLKADALLSASGLLERIGPDPKQYPVFEEEGRVISRVRNV